MAGRATCCVAARVFDGQRHLPGHGAVVADGLVVAVAPDADLDVPAGAEQVDLAGGLLLPGFQDAHVHPVQGGLERTPLRPDRGCPRARSTSPPSRATRPRTPSGSGSSAAAGR